MKREGEARVTKAGGVHRAPGGKATAARGRPTPKSDQVAFQARRRRETLAHWDALLHAKRDPLERIDWARSIRLRTRLGLEGPDKEMWELQVLFNAPEARRWGDALRRALSISRTLAAERQLVIDEFAAVEAVCRALADPHGGSIRVTGTDKRTKRKRSIMVATGTCIGLSHGAGTAGDRRQGRRVGHDRTPRTGPRER
jgi:hypothetical protein